MAVPFVPFALLLQLQYPKGQRLPKLTEYKPPAPAVTIPVVYRQYPGATYTRPQAATPQSDPPIAQGNLTNDEYRFWIGCVNKEMKTGQCRVCGRIFATPQARLDHLNAGPCKVTSLSIAQVLRRRCTCAVCGKSQTHNVWGVPLCTACIHPWRFLSARAQSPFSVVMVEVLQKINEESLYEKMQ